MRNVKTSNDFKIGYLYREDDLFFVVVELDEKAIGIESLNPKKTGTVLRKMLSPSELNHIYEIGKLEDHPEYLL